MHPQNNNIPFPVVLTAPESSRAYFDAVLDFLAETLGTEATQKLKLFIGEPEEAAVYLKEGLQDVRAYRKATSDAYYFNWNLHIPMALQQPFEPTHDNIAALNISSELAPHELASQLRSVFSAIVAGNVKKEGLEQIAKNGPFQIHGDADIMQRMDTLLKSFVEQKRMKLGTDNYEPCYRIIVD